LNESIFKTCIKRKRAGHGGIEILGRMGGYTDRWLCGWRGGWMGGLLRVVEPFKDEVQTALFKDPVRTAL